MIAFGIKPYDKVSFIIIYFVYERFNKNGCLPKKYIRFQRSWIEFSQFPLETEKKKKNPVHPVDPVREKNKIESIP